jgi:hypothetical protein
MSVVHCTTSLIRPGTAEIEHRRAADELERRAAADAVQRDRDRAVRGVVVLDEQRRVANADRARIAAPIAIFSAAPRRLGDGLVFDFPP